MRGRWEKSLVIRDRLISVDEDAAQVVSIVAFCWRGSGTQRWSADVGVVRRGSAWFGNEAVEWNNTTLYGPMPVGKSYL